MEIRRADQADKSAVCGFYHDIIEDMQSLPYHPKWHLNIYPADSYLEAALAAGTLCICDDGGIVGAMILNHHCAKGYDRVSWGVHAEPTKTTVIHTLAVKVSRMNQGIGRSVVEYAKEIARAEGQTTIRLDVLDVARRITNILMGVADGGIDSDVPVILAADDLAPSETLQPDKSKILALSPRAAPAILTPPFWPAPWATPPSAVWAMH